MPTPICPYCESKFRTRNRTKTIGGKNRVVVYCKSCDKVLSILDN